MRHALDRALREVGWIGSLLAPLGIAVAYTPLGIFVALLFVGLPYVIRTVQPVLAELDAKAEEAAGPREGSKTAQVVAMLQRKNDATLTEIMEKMGWQRHTVRGFMAGAMKKAGHTVESFKSEKGERTYRVN